MLQRQKQPQRLVIPLHQIGVSQGRYHRDPTNFCPRRLSHCPQLVLSEIDLFLYWYKERCRRLFQVQRLSVRSLIGFLRGRQRPDNMPKVRFWLRRELSSLCVHLEDNQWFRRYEFSQFQRHPLCGI